MAKALWAPLATLPAQAINQPIVHHVGWPGAPAPHVTSRAPGSGHGDRNTAMSLSVPGKGSRDRQPTLR
jgi:hypothetical protein